MVSGVDGPYDKDRATRWLGYLTTGNRGEVDRLCSRRVSGGFAHHNDLIDLFNILVKDKDNVINRLFMGRLGIGNKHLARFRFMTEGECEKSPNAGGFYNIVNNVIAIRPKYDELTTLNIIGHEYAHNWQFKGGTLEAFNTKYYGGLLLLEGFAEWVAYKIMGFYASYPSMDQIDKRRHDEYGEGFDLFLWIEEHYGVEGIMNFASSRPPIPLEELLRSSGLLDVIEQISGERKKWPTDIEDFSQKTSSMNSH